MSYNRDEKNQKYYLQKFNFLTIKTELIFLLIALNLNNCILLY